MNIIFILSLILNIICLPPVLFIFYSFIKFKKPQIKETANFEEIDQDDFLNFLQKKHDGSN